jgi:diguanylate cyclase (GGDEF)-like protein/PAS domain S-box-containing protein
MRLWMLDSIDLLRKRWLFERFVLLVALLALDGYIGYLQSQGHHMRSIVLGVITVLGTIALLSTDITERRQAAMDRRIAAIAFESQEGMMITDAQSVILRVNRAFTEITGYSDTDVIGETPRLLQSGRHNADFYRAMWETIHRTGGWQGEIWDKRKNGEVYPKWLAISAVKNDDGAVTHYIGTHFDISERKMAEKTIRQLAYFDQLTGLPNRSLLLDRLTQVIAANGYSSSHGAVIFIDLDYFKTLNDTLGHAMGDLLLQQVAQRLRTCVREGDTVARLGGDEFVVMLVSRANDQRSARTGIETVAKKILSALNQPYQLNNVAFHSTASIGIAEFGRQSATVDDLMRQADLAMYQAKDAGRNRFRFFDARMECAVKERAALEHDLRRAVDQNQFTLHYQAQVVRPDRVTGAEVLVRWQHPRRGIVSPSEFIPLAEETGLILPLGNWVLKTACAQLASWAARLEMAHLTLAVNVSAHQFRLPDFVDQVLAVLEDTGANPQRLKLELTESLLVDNVDDVIRKMLALKAKGVGFALDDFGTGYSSLSYLKRLPLDQLKIDQSFVHDVLIDPNGAAIAKTVVALANSLGLNVIAEGVETEAQRDFLASSGCHAYQGYLFGRPVPIGDFEDFVRLKACLKIA